jgi:hypothetical protein
MELIVLNIGLDLRVISPTFFAMMVVMALVTTMATAPMLRLLMPQKLQASHRRRPARRAKIRLNSPPDPTSARQKAHPTGPPDDRGRAQEVADPRRWRCADLFF